MCSVDDDDNGILFMPKAVNEFLVEPSFCRKCEKEKAWALLRQKDAYCKWCFNYQITHKFRRTLGKSKLMNKSDRVLVAFSGSASSFTLAYMLWAGTQENDAKKLLYKLIFCYIDDGYIAGHSKKSRQELITNYRKFIQSLNFEFHSLPLNGLSESDDQRLFSGLKTSTSKEDLLSKMRQRRLVEIARNLKCCKIFTAETQNNLAVKLMTSIALGRGEQLSQEVGFADNRYTDISILRPLRDIDKKEIEYFVELHGLPCIEPPTIPSVTTSIKKLTKEFLAGLQKNFEPTTAIVFRTGEKLCTSSSSTEAEKCLLCDGPNMITEDGYGAGSATAFSRKVSRPCSGGECCGEGSCSGKNILSKMENMRLCFCYGCHLIIKEMTSLEDLPEEIKKAALARITLESMKNEIQNFLL